MNKDNMERFFKARYGFAKFSAIILAITYFVTALVYNTVFEKRMISVAMMFAAMAVVFLVIQAFGAVAKHCLCELDPIRTKIYTMSLVGILVAFYAKDIPVFLLIVWPIMFAIPASYVITTYLAIWSKPKRNVVY